MYHILIRFVAEDAIQPDEEEAHRIAQEERAHGEVLSDAEVWSQRFDYTEWRRKHFDAMAPGEFHAQAQEYAKAHPYTGKATRI